MSELFHPDVDIKKLTVETPESPKDTFDPEKDIPLAYWDKLFATAEGAKTNREWDNLLDYLSALSLLGSDYVKQLLDQVTEQKIVRYMDHQHQRIAGMRAPMASPPASRVDFAVVLPHQRHALHLSDHDFNLYKSQFSQLYDATGSTGLNTLRKVKILYPNRFHEIYPDTDDYWHEAVETEPTTSGLRARPLARLKLIDPIRSAKLTLTPEEWQAAKALLVQAPEEARSGNFWLPAHLRMVAAKSIHVDEAGIHLEAPDTLDRSAEPNTLPEQRRY